MYVTGHGISADVLHNARAAVAGYFSLPLATKQRHRITRDNYRGYIPLGFFSPNSGADDADAYEGYKLHFEAAPDDPVRVACALYGSNKWPEQAPALRPAISAYWRECDRVANTLLAALAQIMGINVPDFLQLFESPLTNMTLLHYPPQPAGQDGFGIHPHKDTDALTILAPDPVGG